ncbi:hypothetical protein J5N97_015902 [Dioscorea zingiberensis]|uniref:Uncharacterized protein n=1 Tax=Dioscorea zingiberensis TaxID=325984 RepID=A0A9D5HF56_9LILI|nr:hypothetical protein J5N97_015902 [Dioscorea zingiberensis]
MSMMRNKMQRMMLETVILDLKKRMRRQSKKPRKQDGAVLSARRLILMGTLLIGGQSIAERPLSLTVMRIESSDTGLNC